MKLPKKIFLGTYNKDKIRELAQLLKNQKVEIVTPYHLPQPYPDPEEVGKTYLENALIKARAAATSTGIPALAEDSGFEVLALGGKPGLHSKRWYGKESDEEARNKKILQLLKNTKDRRARYVTTMALVDPNGNIIATGVGVLPGEVLTRPARKGFAYDRIFAVKGRPVSEMSVEEKNRISQRKKALQALLKNLTSKESRKSHNKLDLLKKASTRIFKQAQTPQNQLPSKTYPVKQYQAELNNAWKEAIRRATRGGGVNKHWANYLKGNVPSAKEYLQNPRVGALLEGSKLRGKSGPMRINKGKLFNLASKLGVDIHSSVPIAYGRIDNDSRAVGWLLNRIDVPWAPDQPRFVQMTHAPTWLRDRYWAWLRKMHPRRQFNVALRKAGTPAVAVSHYMILDPNTYNFNNAAHFMPYLVTPQDIVTHELVHLADQSYSRASSELEAVLRELVAKAKFYQIAGKRYPQLWQQASRVPIVPGHYNTLGDLVELAKQKGIDPDSPNFNPNKRFSDIVMLSDRMDPWNNKWLKLNPLNQRNPFPKALWREMLPSFPKMYAYPVNTFRNNLIMSNDNDPRLDYRPSWWFKHTDTKARNLLYALHRFYRGVAGPAERDLIRREYNMPLPAVKSLLDHLRKNDVEIRAQRLTASTY